MKALKPKGLVAVAVVLGLLVAFPGTTLAATEKDASLRLNVMNLDCTVDQVIEGNSPTYIVNPAGCYVPPVIEIINENHDTTDDQEQNDVPDFLTEPFVFSEEPPGVPDTFGPIASIPNEVPIYPEDAVPVTPVSGLSQSGSVVVTSVAIGSTVVVSTIVVDALIFNSQLVNAGVSVIRRIVQFIFGVIGR